MSLALAVGRLGGQRVELFSWSKALFPLFHDHLPLLEHVHELDADEGPLRRIERLGPQHRAGDPHHSSLILLHDFIEVLHLTEGDGGPMLLIVTPDGGGIGLTPINRHLRRHTIAANGLGQEALGRPLVPLLREEKVSGLAGFVHTPAEPHWPLGAVERLLELGTILEHSAVDGHMVDEDTVLLHELFE
jgi:hypothetical protein